MVMKKIKWMLIVAVASAAIITACNKDEKQDPVPDANAIAYESASASQGGIMYDKFWSAQAQFDQSNPSISTFNTSADFFRCKQCHGWDGLGSNGAYIGRGPKTSRPNVSNLNIHDIAKNKSYLELFNAMKSAEGRRALSYDLSTYDPSTNFTEGDKMPDYSKILTDAQIWDIVKFLKEGMWDVSQLYDATYAGTYPTGSFTITNLGKDGDEAKGNLMYASNCAACHGDDGTTLALEGKTVGDFTRTKGNEVQHKIKYGQLGSVMLGDFDITLAEMKDLYKALSNETNFPN